MRPTRLGGRASVVATTTASVLAVGLIVTVATVSDGYRAQRMDLGDAAVWVTNQSQSLLGRANTQVLQLNSAVPAASETIDVVQNGKDVLLLDTGANTLGIVDQATAAVGKSIPLPPRQPAVSLSEKTVAVEAAGTGDLWVMPIDRLAGFSAESDPTLSLGAGTITALAPDGSMFAYSPGTGSLYRVDGASGSATAVASVPLSDSAVPSLTTVGGRWALLDADSQVLHLPGRAVDLAGLIGAHPVLQRPAAHGDAVLLASEDGLLSVPFGGGKPSRSSPGSAASGEPTAPVVVGGCAYAAWTSGTLWRRCGTVAPATASLPAMPSGAHLAFRVSGRRVLLNDTRTGTAWAVQDGNAVIDNWAQFIPEKKAQNEKPVASGDTPPQYETAQTPPVAVDDEFGARPGRVSTLPVLLSDYDANGDVLVIGSLAPPPGEEAIVQLTGNHQQVQVTLPGDASGTLTFGYTVTDGRGGSASASVTVTVRAPYENSPPRQVRDSTMSVAALGRGRTNVLGDWYDPDGDAFYLASASVAAPDSVTSNPDGTIVYTDASGASGERAVALVVADQQASATGRLAVAVDKAANVPIVTTGFAVLVRAGQPVTISPLGHVSGGRGQLRLANVPSRSHADIVPDYDAGTFRFTGSTIGSQLLSYSVTDGHQTVTGTVRVDVLPPPTVGTQPTTAQHTAFIREQSSKDVDVLATDVDPMGGVLVVTGVSDVPAGSGIAVDVVEQRLLRVSLTRPLDAGPVSFHYQVTSGLADAEGTVTIVQLPALTRHQPPVALPDTISVRVSDAITIPVLDNDMQPDGEELTLDPELAGTVPADGGLLFASGNVLRYLAPAKAGNFTAAYRVSAPDGQWATAQVKIQVRERDAAANRPPAPKPLTARVMAGGTVRIPIPLTGVDPDGDSVQLLGQETSPAKGSVTGTGSDWIEYQAGEYSAGTDSFEYSVVDALGARAVGVVQVGIAPRAEVARNPVARPDEVTVRPGATLSVPVLDNDSDPDGGALAITDVTPTGALGAASLRGDVVSVKAPGIEGRYGFIYQVQNGSGGSASTFLTVIVRADAPLPRPVASDAVLDLSDILGRDYVDVDVLGSAFFAGGSVSTLRVGLLPGYSDSAQVQGDKSIRVQIGKSGQIVPFSLTNPAGEALTSYAFIWVPGRDDALPQLKRGLQPLTAVSEKTLTIDLNDYVIAALGRRVMLTDASSVQATHANGDDLVVDGDTLTYTSADRYFGPAAISFQVTDGTSPTDLAGRVATLVLPIHVTPRQNQPPAFTGATIDFEPGGVKTVNLLKLTSYPYAKDQAELRYRILDPKPAGFALRLDGTMLTIDVDRSTRKGTVADVLVGVRDSMSEGHSGRIRLEVVPSTKPLPIPQPDRAAGVRGTSTTIDVLGNDEATNPFPDVPLRVVAVRGIDSDSLPAGIRVVPSGDRSRLTVTISSDAQPVDTTVQYEVADATGDPDRYAWGQAVISVQDVPDPVTNLTVTGVANRSVSLSWEPGPANNSAITGFEVTATEAGSGKPAGVTKCKTTTCTITTPGNGKGNALLLTVVARNDVGTGRSAAYPEPVWSDIVPAAPVGLGATPLDHGLRMTWQKPPDAPGASPITSYEVTMAGRTVPVKAAGDDPVGTTYTASISDPDLANGSDATFTVTAKNEYYGGGANWNSTSATAVPAGAPLAANPPVPKLNDSSGTKATLAWPNSFTANGKAISRYFAAVYPKGGTAPACTVTGVADGQPKLQVSPNGTTFKDAGTATTATFTGLSPNTAYSFLVYAYNGQGCTPSSAVTATPRRTPGTPTAVQVSGPEPDQQQLHYDYRLTGVTYSSAGGYRSAQWNYRLSGDGFTTETGTLPGSGGSAGSSVGGILSGQQKHYNTKVSVSVQVCETYDEGTSPCSGWSAPTVLGTPVTTAVGGLNYDAATGVFTWTSAPPTTPDAPAVTYQCTDIAMPSPMGQTGSCDTGGAAPDVATLTVRVTANGKEYTKMYPGG